MPDFKPRVSAWLVIMLLSGCRWTVEWKMSVRPQFGMIGAKALAGPKGGAFAAEELRPPPPPGVAERRIESWAALHHGAIVTRPGFVLGLVDGKQTELRAFVHDRRDWWVAAQYIEDEKAGLEKVLNDYGIGDLDALHRGTRPPAPYRPVLETKSVDVKLTANWQIADDAYGSAPFGDYWSVKDTGGEDAVQITGIDPKRVNKPGWLFLPELKLAGPLRQGVQELTVTVPPVKPMNGVRFPEQKAPPAPLLLRRGDRILLMQLVQGSDAAKFRQLADSIDGQLAGSNAAGS